MAEKEKFYWLKLWRDFFRRTEIRLIEAMPNGKEYVLFYLKLLCEGLDNEGYLLVNKTIPYNEEMLSAITNTNIDIIRSAVKVFTSMGMMQLMDNGAYYLDEVKRMTGSAVNSDEANRQRRSRENRRVKEISAPDTDVTMCHELVTNFVTKNNESIEIENRDRDRDRDNNTPLYSPKGGTKSNNSHRSSRTRILSNEQQALFDKFYKEYPKKRAVAEAEKAWSKINPVPDEAFTEQAIRVVKAKLASGEWSKERIQYIPHPSSFLNEKGYLDETEWSAEDPTGDLRPVMSVEKNPRGYDPSNGFSEEELDRRKEIYRQLAKEREERGEL